MVKSATYKQIFLVMAIGLSLLICTTTLAYATAGDVEWQNNYGGNGSDIGNSVQQTADGGYIVAGTTTSFGNGSQVYLVKTDADGTMIWQNTYGGYGSDSGNSMQQTGDGGYIIAGTTDTIINDGQAYLIKTYANGTIEWQHDYGYAGNESANSVQQTADGGYIVAGTTDSFDNTSEAYLIKTGADGTLEWQYNYGNADISSINAVQQTSDGGYVIAGNVYNENGDVLSQAYLARIYANGTLEWRYFFNMVGDDGYCYCTANSVQQTADGGYIMCGQANIDGSEQIYLVKTSASGNLTWQSDSEGDLGFSVKQTGDGGYIVAAQTWENGEVGLVKYSSAGVTEWTRDYGVDGDGYCAGRSVGLTADGDYILVGNTDQLPGGHVYLLKISGKTAPAASFTTNVTSGEAPLTVQFNDTSVGSPTSWQWNFGDNTSNVTTPNATHTFLNPGLYNVVLTVLNGSTSNTSSELITVDQRNPAVIIVDPRPGVGMFTNITPAIAYANPGDTIIVNSGYYQENVVVDKAITLIGNDTGNGKPLVDGGHGHAINITANGVTLEGFNTTCDKDDTICGIYVSSNNNTVTGNTASHNWFGIFFRSSNNNTVTGNTAYNNGDGIFFQYSCNNNTVTGNNASDNVNYGFIFQYSCNNNSVTGNTANDNGNGFVFDSSGNNTVTGNMANDDNDNDMWGIFFHYSSNNTVTGNTANNDYADGIFFQFSNNNTVIGNIVSKDGDGISLDSSSNDNNVTGNTANNNIDDLAISGSSNGNKISRNIAGSISLSSSSDNVFWLNSLGSAYVTDGINKWNSTAPILYTYAGQTYLNYTGNYWSSVGPDNNGDGIVDTPYQIDGNNIDRYPMLTSSVPNGSSITVDPRPGIGMFTNISAALTFASSGDTVFVDSGHYRGSLVLNKAVNLTGLDTGSGMPVIDGNGGTGIYVKANGVSIHGFNVTNGSTGIYAYSNACVTGNNLNNNKGSGIFLYGSGNNVSGNIETDNNVGIYLYGSSGNGICGNDASDNRLIGIYLLNSSGDNLLQGNTVNGIHYGIFSYNSGHNDLLENAVNGDYYGVYLYNSSDNVIDRNAANDSNAGIYLHGYRNNVSGNTVNGDIVGLCISTNSSDNSACENTVVNNSYGIYVYGSSGDRLWSNVIMQNTINAYVNGGLNNWNSASEQVYTYNGQRYVNYIGNFWGDYRGHDLNGDGIGDTPYAVYANNADLYPMLQGVIVNG